MNIIWLRPDGGVSITILCDAATDPNKHAAELKKRGDIPEDWEVKETAIELPKDRVFREAWAWNTEEPIIDMDMDKAKEVVHGKRRIKREEELTPFDKEINIKISNTSEVTRIEAERKKIRTKHTKIQTKIDKCIDEKALRAVILSEDL